MVPKVAAFALLVLTAATFVVTPGAAGETDAECGNRIGEILVGTGDVGIDLVALHDVNHVDVQIPAPCSRGAFYIDAQQSGAVAAKVVCGEGIVRVYATAGTLAQDFTVRFLEGGSC